jgi:metallo-beta-lactamase family protein
MSKNLKLTFCGGVQSVTGANFLLESDNTKILIDCGLEQGTSFAEPDNRKAFFYDPSSINYLFVTHAHLDHIGRIPKLVRDGFRGEIYSTPETKSLAELMLPDAFNILTFEAKRSGQEPLYGPEDIQKALSLWKTIPYRQKAVFGDFEVFAKDAGHILGSAIYEITCEKNGKKIKTAFCDDLGNSPDPLLPDTEPITDADYVVMDSVYGDRNHEPIEERERRFREIVTETIQKGGTLVIPAFSLERTQVILYELNKLIEGGDIRSVPVFLDSPLAIKVTEIYEKVATSYFNSEVKKEIDNGDDIFDFPKLKSTVRSEDSKAILDVPSPKIIIAGSGMSNGGRVMHHELNYLPDPKSTILLMGYQSVGTLGRQIQEGAKAVRIMGEIVPIKARVEVISGYSSHKDSDHLVEFAEKTSGSVKKIFVAMGEPKSALFLVQKLRDQLGIDAISPEANKSYELI